jgi:hypothetical protein
MRKIPKDRKSHSRGGGSLKSRMALADSGSHKRKNFSEDYLQFGQAPSALTYDEQF